MFVTCWSVKGGAGVSVVSASLAALAVQRHGDVVLVDLDGDQPAVLGLPEPAGPGVLDWCHSEAPPEALARLLVPVTDGLSLLPRGGRRGRSEESVASQRAGLLVEWLGRSPAVVVDAGDTVDPPEPSDAVPDAVAIGDALRAAGASVVVTRACYLALRRAVRQGRRADGLVLVAEPGRSLRAEDVAEVLHLPLLGVVEYDPAVARRVDAGTLVRRLPVVLRRGLPDPEDLGAAGSGAGGVADGEVRDAG